MAMVNGQWQEEDASVEKRVAGMVQSGSPLMTVARTNADKEANRRGLANSSIAVGKGTEAVIKTATPIASQDAGQIHERNLSAQNYGQTKDITGMQIQGQKDITGMQITSNEGIAAADRGSRETIATGDRTSRETISRDDRIARTNDNRYTTDAQVGVARDDRTARTSDNAADRTSRETIARDDRVAQTNVASVNAVTSTNSTYATTMNAIMSNPDIPADARNVLIQNAAITRDNTIGLISDVFDVDLPWTPATGGSGGTPAQEQPVPSYPTAPAQMPPGWDENGRWVGE